MPAEHAARAEASSLKRRSRRLDADGRGRNPGFSRRAGDVRSRPDEGGFPWTAPRRRLWEGAARFSMGRGAEGSRSKPAARGMLETAHGRREGSRGRGRWTRPLARSLGLGWAAPRPTASRRAFGGQHRKSPARAGLGSSRDSNHDVVSNIDEIRAWSKTERRPNRCPRRPVLGRHSVLFPSSSAHSQ